MRFIIARIMGLFFTGYGFYLFCTGKTTNGLLSMILGELIDIPKINIKGRLKYGGQKGSKRGGKSSERGKQVEV